MVDPLVMSPQPHAPAGAVRVTFLGDTLVGGVGQGVLDEKGPDWAFDGIRPLLEDWHTTVAQSLRLTFQIWVVVLAAAGVMTT